MAARTQILVPLIFAVFVEGQFDYQPPFFGIPGLRHLAQQKLDEVIDHQPHNFNIDNYQHPSWEHHVLGQQNHPNYIDGHRSYDDHRPYGSYYPFIDGEIDPYFGIGPFGTGNFDHMPIPYPGIHKIFNDNGDINSDQNEPSGTDNYPKEYEHRQDNINEYQKVINNDKNFEKEPNQVLQTNHPSKKYKDQKLNQSSSSDINSNLEELPPKTNQVEKDEKPQAGDIRDDKTVDINEKKDYLLIGSDNGGHNVYLLHENKPNTNTGSIPNAYQPENNIVYVPYKPGQYNNPVYQVVSGQPAPLPVNQVTPDKLNVNVNGITIPGQPTVNINTADQNQQYVVVYSNGQLIKIPGIVVNSSPVETPLQNGNYAQGMNAIVSNNLPNNIQNELVSQNSGTNVIYTNLPNQETSGSVLQAPNNGLVSNAVGDQLNQNLVSKLVLLLNGASNGYGQLSNMVPYQGGILNNQNIPLQPAVQIPTNTDSNIHNQLIVSDQGQVPDVAVNLPNPAAILNDQNIQPVFQNNQLLSPDKGQEANSAVNVNQSTQLLVNSVPNIQPIVPSQGDQEANSIVDIKSDDTIISQPEIDQPVPNNNALILDSNNLSGLRAQSAIIISGFKETADGNEHEEDKKNGKDKSKKKHKENKSGGLSKENTNK